jgi:chromosome segregation ATPase
MKLNLQFFAEPGGDPAGDNPGSDDGAGTDTNIGGSVPEDQGNKGEDAKTLLAQIEQLKADLAKQKSDLDKATSEAGKYRKELRAKQTQEEIDAENKKEEQEKAAARLAELEKEVARAKSTKSVMAKLGVDEDAAGNIAECLAGCEDVDNALLLIKKAWDAKEKALKLEYGKIPGPGAGGSNEDKETQAALALAKELGQRKAQTATSVRDQLKGLVR